MSWDLSADVGTWPNYREALARFGTPDLVCAPSEPGSREWPSGLLSFHRAGISTRTVEVTREKTRLEVRVPACACAEDYDLALAIVEAVVQDPEATIHADVLGDVRLAQVGAWRVPDWLSEAARGPLKGLVRLVETQGAMTMQGPVRPYTLGPRLLGHLRSASDEDSLPERILADIRRVQWGPETRGRRDASVFVTEEGDGRRGTRIAFWALGQSLILPGAVDFYVFDLAAEPGASGHIFVPQNRMAEVAGELFAGFLDESSGLINPAEGAAREALLARARDASVDVRTAFPNAPGGRPKRWWQFWR